MANYGRTVSSFLSGASLASGSNIHSVHATLSNAGTPASPAVIISWAVGVPTIGPIAAVWPSATPPPTASSGAFPAPGAAASSVYLSATSNGNGAAATLYSSVPPVAGTAIQYLRNYTTPTKVTDPSGNKRAPFAASRCVLAAGAPRRVRQRTAAFA